MSKYILHFFRAYVNLVKSKLSKIFPVLYHLITRSSSYFRILAFQSTQSRKMKWDNRYKHTFLLSSMSRISQKPQKLNGLLVGTERNAEQDQGSGYSIKGETYEAKKKLKDLNLCDDFMFFQVMNDKMLCRELVELIFARKVTSIENFNEHKMKPWYEAKGIRLDVYLEGDNKLYIFEMQNGKEIHLPVRSRYYQSVNDLTVLKPGDDVSRLKKNYVIFICTYPIFDEKRHIYHFRNICEEDKTLELNDKTEKIFVSTKGTGDDINEAMREFLNFVETSDTSMIPKSDFVKHLQKKVREIKNNPRMEGEYMTYEMKMLDKFHAGKKEGFIAGKKEEKAAIIKAMLKRNISAEEISYMTDIPIEEIGEV